MDTELPRLIIMPARTTFAVGDQSGFASLTLLAKEPSMFRDPRAMLGLLVVCAMVAWAMVLLV